jgi:hypothetical protein
MSFAFLSDGDIPSANVVLSFFQVLVFLMVFQGEQVRKPSCVLHILLSKV